MEGMTFRQRAQAILQSLYYPLMAIIASLLVGSLVILLTSNTNPFVAYGHMISGGFGTLKAFDATLIKAVPLLFTALSFAIAKRSGIINLGAEGQFMIGALCATAVGVGIPSLPMAIHLPLTLIAGFVGGALFGLITGVLKVKFGASELIITIMLNYIARLLVAYFVTGPMLEQLPPYYPQSASVAKTARLEGFIPGLNVHTGLLLALLCVFLYYFYLWKTTSGFRMRVVGLNPSAGEYAGMSVARSTLLSLFVALLGNLNPIGIIFSGILFGGLSAGSLKMEVLTRDVNSYVAVVIQALIILFIAGRQMFQFKRKRKHISIDTHEEVDRVETEEKAGESA